MPAWWVCSSDCMPRCKVMKIKVNNIFLCRDKLQNSTNWDGEHVTESIYSIPSAAIRTNDSTFKQKV